MRGAISLARVAYAQNVIALRRQGPHSLASALCVGHPVLVANVSKRPGIWGSRPIDVS